MAYWLMKTEPGDYSWDQLVADGTAEWDGVHNHQAAGNMRAMKLGDRVFFYRSMKNPAVVGVMEIAREAYEDPKDPKQSFVLVDVRAVANVVGHKEGCPGRVTVQLGRPDDVPLAGIEPARLQEQAAQGVWQLVPASLSVIREETHELQLKRMTARLRPSGEP